MQPSTPRTVDHVRLRPVRMTCSTTALIAIAVLLLAWAAVHMAVTTSTQGRGTAMTPECHQAYRAYMEATDPAEADFWAESWITFGCESGGYWA
jgi:hypothetical protein